MFRSSTRTDNRLADGVSLLIAFERIAASPQRRNCRYHRPGTCTNAALHHGYTLGREFNSARFPLVADVHLSEKGKLWIYSGQRGQD